MVRVVSSSSALPTLRRGGDPQTSSETETPVNTLAICIPTYNRAALLRELLDDVVAEATGRVEVVVADDASPDGTLDVVESFRGRLPGLRVVAHETNVGLDRNFLAAVDAASADYVWLIGDDDRIEPGGLQRVLEALDRWDEVTGLTLGVVDYDFAMTRPVGLRRTPPTTLLRGDAEVFTTLADLLGFMSALVIRRTSWQEVARRPGTDAFRNFYVQVYILGRAVGPLGTWGVVQDPCIRFRTENDQLQGRYGWVDRLRIDVGGYRQITATLFHDRPRVRRAVDGRILEIHAIARIVNAVAAGTTLADRVRALRVLAPAYRGHAVLWTRVIPILFTPRGLLRAARTAYQSMSRNSGSSRALRTTGGAGRN